MIDKSVLNTLLKFGVDRGASDIHFEVGGPPRYRLKGELLKAKYEALTPEATVTIAQIVLGQRQVDLTRLFPEQDVSYSIPGVSRFRASVFRQRGSVGVVLRVIPYKIHDFSELNLPGVLAQIASTRRGLALVTGATGMGKSTTIAAMLNHINRARNAHIITIEDPIEFLIEDERSMIIQREIGTDTHSYADALIAALRQDPDVIMLGEIRDEITARTCLKAAETGHLLISTLHTPDATATIKRLTGFFNPAEIETQLARIAECLQAVVSLRLLRTAKGAAQVPAVEIMRVTHTLQECIRDQSKHGDIVGHIAQGRDLYEMQTFDQHLKQLVQSQVISMETARAAASRPDDLERSLTIE